MLRVFPDVEYLLQARQISNEDAQLILSKVPQPIHVDPAPAPPAALVHAGSSLQLTTLPTPILNSNIQPAASPPAQPPHHSLSQSGGAVAKRAVPPPPKKVQARALWDYNIDGDVRDPVLIPDPTQPPVTRPHAFWTPSESFPITMTFSELSYILPITISPRSPYARPVTLPLTLTHIRESPVLTLFPPPIGTKGLDVLQRRHRRDHLRSKSRLVDRQSQRPYRSFPFKLRRETRPPRPSSTCQPQLVFSLQPAADRRPRPHSERGWSATCTLTL